MCSLTRVGWFFETTPLDFGLIRKVNENLQTHVAVRFRSLYGETDARYLIHSK